VFHLVLILLLTFLVLTALLWGGTRLAQGALYEDVQPDLYWRAPAAAAALTVYVGAWSLLNYAAAEPGQTDLPYDNIFNFTAEKVSERPVPGFEAVRGDVTEKYVIRNLTGSPPRYEYHKDPGGDLWLARRATDVDAIVLKEGEREVRFKTVTTKDDQGKEHVERFAEEGGRRYMTEEGFGRITTPRGGGSWFRVLLNVLHFGVWFVVLWLLLRFQWPHALGLAAVLWLVMTFLVPFILRAGAEAKAPPAPPAQTYHVRPHGV
jgi:hypothetical protein